MCLNEVDKNVEGGLTSPDFSTGAGMDIFVGLLLGGICAAIGFAGWKLFKAERVPAVIRKPIGGVVIVLGGLFSLAFVTMGFTNKTPEEIAAEEAAAAKRAEEDAAAAQAKAEAEAAEQRRLEQEEKEKRRSGLHCLSQWDGSNRSAVAAMKSYYLRDPDSFEHIETRILPLDESTGEHGAIMRYRARNGFGGMNVEAMYLRINSESCDARLLPDGPGSE